MGYFRKHWRGELSLSVSFWVNFVFINIALSIFSVLSVKDTFFTDYPVYICRIALIAACFRGFVILPWQFVGLWRAGTKHVNRCGKRFWAIITKVLIVLVVCVHAGVTIYCWPALQQSFRVAFLKDDTPGYTMELLDDNAILHFEGGLPFGTSKEVKKVLDANPDIKKVILDSSGGRIYEAQKIADMILHRQLDTYTVRGCYSAATIPFAAGKNRFLCAGAALGFHQYSISESSWDYDFQKEYQKDWAFYQSRGVTKDFQEKMFRADPNDFWIPSDLELYNGGMIHAVLKLTDILPMEDAIVFGYDTSRKSSEIASDDITDEQIKGWILGCSSVLWERNRDDFVTLAGEELNELNIESQKASISEWWGIEDRKSLLKCLYGLTQRGGHNEDFIRDGQRVYKMTDEELEAFLEQYTSRPQRCNEYRIAHQYYQALGEKGILAWETTRYMCLCRWGYLCGWLDEQTAWELMIPIARHIQQQFGSWEEMGQNYLIGRHYWSLKHFQDGKELYDEALCRLLEMPSSPWNKYPWNLDLSGAYEIVPATIPLQEEVEASTPAAVEPTDESKPLMPAIDILVLPELIFSKVNTLSDLQKNSPVLVVPDEYETIQVAIDAAKEGDTIFIKEGVYSEHVSMKKKNRIRIVGQNTSKVILRSTDPNSYSVLYVEDCRNVVISDLTVAGHLKGLKDDNYSLTIKNSEFEIIGCRIVNKQDSGIGCFSGARGTIKNTLIESCLSAGVAVAESGTNVTISGCCIRDNKKSGFNGYKGASVVIHNTSFERNEYGALISERGTKATFTNCVIRENMRDGLSVYNQAQVRIEGTVFASNKRIGISASNEHTQLTCIRSQCLNNEYGILVNKAASADIKECIVAENKKYGVLIRDPATTANMNEVRCSGNNEMGIGVVEGAALDVRKSFCFENDQCGAIFSSGSSGTISSSVCFENTKSGIIIHGKDTHAVVRNNRCFDNDKSGIRIYDGASAEVQDNICKNNKQNGIDVYQDGASGVLQNNRCLENQKDGILFSHGASGTIEGNFCENNEENGIVVFEKGSQAEINGNTCSMNHKSGIRISDSASAQIEDNVCQSNKQNGIDVYQNGASAILKNNRCFWNGHHGISFSDSATGTAENCLCEENVRSGIMVTQKGTQADLLNNQCSANKYNGIVISNGAGSAVNLTGNTCLGNYPSGILIHKGSTGQVSHNTCRYNPWAGIAVQGEGTHPTVTENTFDNNGTWGILLWTDAEPDLDGNTTENNGVEGLMERE